MFPSSLGWICHVVALGRSWQQLHEAHDLCEAEVNPTEPAGVRASQRDEHWEDKNCRNAGYFQTGDWMCLSIQSFWPGARLRQIQTVQ